MSPLDRFHSFIQEQGLFEASDHILLAVSGGRDSVLLVHFFKQCGFNFGIAHCNFMLRGAESKADELVVSELATRMEVPFFSTFLDAKSYASTHHVSIQMAARDLRYRWLEKMRAEFGFRYVALAHHQNDTVETMLLNLTRGTGIAGLHGILPKRDALIRPMLCFNRAEIDRTIAEMNISYRDDRSNRSTKYARNKIRLEVIPKLKELNPRLEETFEANRKRFAELEMILNDRIAALHDALFKEVANEKIKHYIKKFPAGRIILETVEKKLENILTRYKNTHSPRTIPFAFKSKIASKSMEELREICRKKGISGYSKYGKKDLVDFIVKNLKKKSK